MYREGLGGEGEGRTLTLADQFFKFSAALTNRPSTSLVSCYVLPRDAMHSAAMLPQGVRPSVT